MALSDPFSETLRLSQERSGGIERGFGSLGQVAYDMGMQGIKGRQEKEQLKYKSELEQEQLDKQKQDSYLLMKKMGLITEAPPTYQELEKYAGEHNIKIDTSGISDMTEDRKRDILLNTLKLTNTPIPKGQDFFNMSRAKELQITPEYDPKQGYGFKGATKTGINVADLSNLSPEQQIQARQLARKIGGVRGTENLVPSIAQEMLLGKTIDQIEDDLRYSGQSKEFAGPLRGAAQQIMVGKSSADKQSAFDDLDDLKDNPEEQKSYLKRMALVQAGQEEKRNMMGKERTIKLLDEIQGDLNNLETMGIDTNIFTGTQEQVAAKLGMVVNPEARKIATKTAAAIQNYRRSMTGVQFGMPENQEYKVMFPSISRTANFNSANINALKEVLGGDLENFYAMSMGEDNYKRLFGEQQGSPIANFAQQGIPTQPQLPTRGQAPKGAKGWSKSQGKWVF